MTRIQLQNNNKEDRAHKMRKDGKEREREREREREGERDRARINRQRASQE